MPRQRATVDLEIGMNEKLRKTRWPVASSDFDFSPYLTRVPEAAVDMFWRFVELARAPGPMTFELQKGVIVLRGTRRICASVRVLGDRLTGHLTLARRLTDDRRIGTTQDITKHVVFHRYLVRSLSDLDQEFGQWLAEARAVGDGMY